MNRRCSAYIAAPSWGGADASSISLINSSLAARPGRHTRLAVARWPSYVFNKTSRYLLFAVVCVFVAATSALAQESAPATEDPIHNELRALRSEFLDAFEKKDIDKMLTFLTDNVVITVQNAEVLRGHDEVRAFHERMSGGDSPEVELLKTDFEVDDLSNIYGGDTAVAFGSMDDHFKLKSGMEFDLVSRWTATLVKQDDRWLLAAFHISTNMFDNGVSNLQTKWAATKTGAVALVAGGLLGCLGGVWWKRRKV
jgi:ketosteroid isomerase-like protein